MGKRIVAIWIISIGFSLVAFLAARPVIAQLAEGSELPQINLHETDVGIEAVDGFSQVYFMDKGEKRFVTEGGQNSKHTHARGRFIVWATTINGAGQIFRHNAETGATVQITNSRTNLKPRVSRDGLVVWESFIDEGWKIMLFDGTSTRTVSTGYTAANPDIEGDFVTFSNRSDDGAWIAKIYAISSEETLDVSAYGTEAKFPKLKEGKVVYEVPGRPEVVETLTVSDLFVLDELVPLREQTGEVTSEEILEELESVSVVLPETID